MNIKELQQAGAFVSAEMTKKSITFEIGDEEYNADVYIKPLGIGEHEALYANSQGSDDNVSRTAQLIAAVARFGEGGQEQMSYEDAYQLHPSLASAIMEAYTEVTTPEKKS